MIVRPADPADIPALFAIRTAVHENHVTLAELAQAGVTVSSIAEALRSGTAAAWIALDTTGPLGFSMARDTTGDLFALFVLPRAEGCGVGTSLLQEAELWLASRGIEEAWLLTGGEPGLRAPGFYAARGWQPAGADADGQIRLVKRLIPASA